MFSIFELIITSHSISPPIP
uniref:Uncharacterized protein n=1 Tax=Lepeophtheirus salmonis TaxID=72036 RepID=A0A0K2TG50_LEPSM